MITIEGVEYHEVPSSLCHQNGTPCEFRKRMSGFKCDYLDKCARIGTEHDSSVIFLTHENYTKYIAERLKS